MPTIRPPLRLPPLPLRVYVGVGKMCTGWAAGALPQRPHHLTEGAPGRTVEPVGRMEAECALPAFRDVRVAWAKGPDRASRRGAFEHRVA